MNGFSRVAAVTAGIFALSISSLAAQDSGLVQYGTLLVKPDRVIPGVGRVVIPESSLFKPGDQGRRARTHYLLLIPDSPIEPPHFGATPNVVTPAATTSLSETPASLACVYRLVAQSLGCNPNTFFTVANGGSQAIGIIDWYDNPTVKADLQYFSTYFHLPAPKIEVVYCSAATCTGVTTPPPANQSTAGEIALDVQAAHAMAPHAKIILVEAFSNSYTDLMRAEDRAAQLVAAAGGGQVSNSWGGSDSAGETSLDSHFVHTGVVFFASTGDHKGGTNVADVEWPSTSPNVVAVGGTTILRTSSTKAFSSEKAWLDGGGGISANEARPAYQNGIQSAVGNRRGVPDIAGEADPASGMYVRCQATSCGHGPWLVIGGTSLASPLLAGIANAAAKFRASSKSELTTIYSGLGGAKYNDIHAGKCGNGTGGAFVNAISGWDRCTGVGTPKGKTGL